MSRRPVRVGLAAALVVVAGLGAACSGDEPGPTPATTGPRALSSDESALLAGVRLQNYRREVVGFEIDVPVSGSAVTLVGRADMREHLAVAGGTATPTGGGAPAYSTFAWNLQEMAIVDTGSAPTQQELSQVGEIPDDRWQLHDLAGSTQPLDQVALVLLNLAQDRPDNAQLLRQNGGQWLGSTVVDGTDVDIMSATGTGAGRTLTYYVDPETARAVRVDVNIGADRPATITFLDDEASLGAVPTVAALGAPPSDEPSSDTPG